jgi:hypothetical protein
LNKVDLPTLGRPTIPISRLTRASLGGNGQQSGGRRLVKAAADPR